MADGKGKKTPICIYWDADVGVYRLYLADWSPSMRGYFASTYLGSVSPDDLRRVMALFGYVRVGCVA
jgi:hypothetical protein